MTQLTVQTENKVPSFAQFLLRSRQDRDFVRYNESTGKHSFTIGYYSMNGPIHRFETIDDDHGHTTITVFVNETPKEIPIWLQKYIDEYEEFLKGWPNDLTQKVTIIYQFG